MGLWLKSFIQSFKLNLEFFFWGSFLRHDNVHFWSKQEYIWVDFYWAVLTIGPDECINNYVSQFCEMCNFQNIYFLPNAKDMLPVCGDTALCWHLCMYSVYITGHYISCTHWILISANILYTNNFHLFTFQVVFYIKYWTFLIITQI